MNDMRQDRDEIIAYRARALAASGVTGRGPARVLPPPPIYTPAERFADGVIHMLGVIGSVIAVTILIVLAAPESESANLISLSIYGLGMVLVFCCSAAYHLVDHAPYKAWLRRLDHAAIFIKIAATYTPFAVVSLGGWWGAAILGAVWTIAAVGAPLKLFAPARFERRALWLYLAQGWLALLVVGQMLDALSTQGLVLIACGAALYTGGVVFHLWETLRFHNAIWHACVLTASFCFYGAVATDVAFPERPPALVEADAAVSPASLRRDAVSLGAEPSAAH